jgi:hypothetical protein
VLSSNARARVGAVIAVCGLGFVYADWLRSAIRFLAEKEGEESVVGVANSGRIGSGCALELGREPYTPARARSAVLAIAMQWFGARRREERSGRAGERWAAHVACEDTERQPRGVWLFDLLKAWSCAKIWRSESGKCLRRQHTR